MEEKVVNLEVELNKYKLENSKLKNLLKDKQDEFEKFIEDEKYAEDTVPKLINQNPEKFSLSMLIQAHEPVDFFGAQRKKILKDAFRTIIDNIVPSRIKSYKMIQNYGSVDKFLDQYVKARDSVKAHKFAKEKNETVLDIFCKFSFSDSLIQTWRADVGMKSNLLKLEKCMHELIRARNKIFAILELMNEYFTKSGVYLSYSKEDLSEFFKFVNYLKTHPDYSPINLWRLPVKQSESDVYEDSCLSE